MFNLDLIEQDWLNNSFKLSEEDILKIFENDNATENSLHLKQQEYWQEKGKICSPETKLIACILGGDAEKELNEKLENFEKSFPFPKKNHLTVESQKKVIEGSMYLVFENTHYWNNFFKGFITEEIIYYICLESLINVTKYLVHCGKPVFHIYYEKSVEKNIIKYIAKIKHISYREAYKFIYSEELNNQILNDNSLLDKEEITKPSEIYYLLRNSIYYPNYEENVSSAEFMTKYKKALNDLDDDEKIVMQMSFDIDGNRILKNSEIGEYLGMSEDSVINARKRAFRTLRKNKELIKYYNRL